MKQEEKTDGKDRQNLNLVRRGNYVYFKITPNTNLNKTTNADFKDFCDYVGVDYAGGF
jgi:hypothetical protein